MQKTNKGLEIVKSNKGIAQGSKVILTRKTTKSGKIRHGVVPENRFGQHHLVESFEGLAPAFKVYKSLVRA